MSWGRSPHAHPAPPGLPFRFSVFNPCLISVSLGFEKWESHASRVLALGIDQVEQFVAVTLASLLSPGSLSLLNAARLLFNHSHLFVWSHYRQAAFPVLAKEASEDDLTKFRQTLVSSLLQIAFIALPVSILFIILRIPIVRLVFGAKTFPWAATLLTGKTLAILAVSAAFTPSCNWLSEVFMPSMTPRRLLWSVF